MKDYFVLSASIVEILYHLHRFDPLGSDTRCPRKWTLHLEPSHSPSYRDLW